MLGEFEEVFQEPLKDKELEKPSINKIKKQGGFLFWSLVCFDVMLFLINIVKYILVPKTKTDLTYSAYINKPLLTHLIIFFCFESSFNISNLCSIIIIFLLSRCFFPFFFFLNISIRRYVCFKYRYSYLYF